MFEYYKSVYAITNLINTNVMRSNPLNKSSYLNFNY